MPKYNSEIEVQAKQAIVYVKKLIESKSFFEIRKILPSRSKRQNRYLHLILTWYAIEYGDKLEFVKKEHFKKIVNPDIFICEFVNRKTGEIREDLRSSKDLDTKEMTLSIDRFRNYASQEAGIYLPEANEDKFLKQIEIEAERYKEYL